MRVAILLALFIALAFLGCTSPGTSVTPQPTWTPNQLSSPTPTPTAGSPLEECAGMTGAQKDSCITSVAWRLNDSSYCMQVGSEDLRRMCLTRFGRCDQLDADARELCLHDRAVANLDAGGCGAITNVSLRDDCYSQVAVDSRDPTACAHISQQSNADSCVFNTAIAAKNIAFCGSISSHDLEVFCNAALSGDKTVCSEISDETLRSICEVYKPPK